LRISARRGRIIGFFYKKALQKNGDLINAIGIMIGFVSEQRILVRCRKKQHSKTVLKNKKRNKYYICLFEYFCLRCFN